MGVLADLRLPSLRELSLDFCRTLTNACLASLARLSLERLSVAWTNLSTLEGLGQFKTLSIQGCKLMTEEGLSHVLSSRLEELDIRDCLFNVRGLGTALRKLKISDYHAKGFKCPCSVMELDIFCDLTFAASPESLANDVREATGCLVRVWHDGRWV